MRAVATPVVVLVLLVMAAGCLDNGADGGSDADGGGAAQGGGEGGGAASPPGSVPPPTWTWGRAGPELPLGVAETASFDEGPDLLLVGGFTEAGGGTAPSLIVNLEDSTVQPLLPTHPLPLHHTQMVAVQGALYVFGGYVSGALLPGTLVPGAGPAGWPRTETAWVLPSGGPGWLPLPPMPQQRAAGGAALHDGYVYLIGGIGPTDEYLASVVRFDLATETYEEVAPLPTPRDHLNVVLAEGRIYTIGGRVNSGGSWQDLGTVEVYDIAADTWTTLDPLPVGRGGQAAGILGDHIVVAGGEVAEGEFDVYDDVSALSLVTHTWTELPPMPEARHGGAFGEQGGALYYIGGARLDGGIATGSLRLSA